LRSLCSDPKREPRKKKNPEYKIFLTKTLNERTRAKKIRGKKNLRKEDIQSCIGGRFKGSRSTREGEKKQPIHYHAKAPKKKNRKKRRAIMIVYQLHEGGVRWGNRGL